MPAASRGDPQRGFSSLLPVVLISDHAAHHRTSDGAGGAAGDDCEPATPAMAAPMAVSRLLSDMPAQADQLSTATPASCRVAQHGRELVAREEGFEGRCAMVGSCGYWIGRCPLGFARGTGMA